MSLSRAIGLVTGGLLAAGVLIGADPIPPCIDPKVLEGLAARLSSGVCGSEKASEKPLLQHNTYTYMMC